MFGVLIAIISGIIMSVQGVFNTGVTKQTNLWLATAFVQISAFVICIIIWFLSGKEENVTDLFRIDNKYMLLGGVLGAAITITVIKSMSALGPAKSVMIIVISQLLAAYLIELFGIFEVEKQDFEIRKLIAIIIAIVGVIMFKYK